MTESEDRRFQLDTARALVRLEQRADEQAKRDQRLDDLLSATAATTAALTTRVISLEQTRASTRAVLGFSRVALAVSVATISLVVSLSTRLIQ